MKKIKVKMLTSISGNADGNYELESFSYGPGEIAEIHPKLAEAWIAGGIAERFDVDAATEAPVMPGVETAMMPGPEPTVGSMVGKGRRAK